LRVVFLHPLYGLLHTLRLLVQTSQVFHCVFLSAKWFKNSGRETAMAP
jgi:hypothetical protein